MKIYIVQKHWFDLYANKEFSEIDKVFSEIKKAKEYIAIANKTKSGKYILIIKDVEK